MSMHKRVFVVEDDPSNQRVLRGLIHAIDPETTVDVDECAETAIRRIESEAGSGRTYDLIIADIFLSGRETGLDLWKACMSRFGDTPLIVTSSLPLHQYFDVI